MTRLDDLASITKIKFFYTYIHTQNIRYWYIQFPTFSEQPNDLQSTM